MPVSLPLVMLFATINFIREKKSIWNKYKIVNNSLTIKKITKMQVLDFDNLEKVIFRGNEFLLKFPKETVKIFYEKNTAEIIDYFLKNNLESIYNKKFQEIDESKRLINIDELSTPKHKRLKLILIFIISILCFIDLLVEKTNDFRIYLFIAITLFCAIASFVALLFSFARKNNSSLENEYIDKNGFHLLNNFVPFSEISEISKIQKKWNIVNLKIVTKDNKEYEIPAIGFNGDILYEMYLAKKTNKN